MGESLYANMVIPIAASFPTSDACGGGDPCGNGAEPANTPQEGRTAAAGGVDAVLAAAGAGARKVADVIGRRGRGGGCCCWWIVLAAVIVVVAVSE